MKKIISAVFLMLTFCGICSAQESTVIERLPNGDYIVTIDGTEFRAVSASRAREIAEGRAEFERLRRERDLLIQLNEALRRQSELITKDRSLADAMILMERKRADSFETLYTGERNLRIASENLGNRGRVSSFFEHPAVQIISKIAMPGVITWLAARR